MIAPQDLADAICVQLRRSPCAGAFGDTYDPGTETGTPKFFADYAEQVTPPYLWFNEVGETYTYLSPGPSNLRPFLAEGTFVLTIIATPRSLARSLGLMVSSALNDADADAMTWNSAFGVYTLRFLRLMSASFLPITEIGVATPAVFARVLTFSYQYEGMI